MKINPNITTQRSPQLRTVLDLLRSGYFNNPIDNEGIDCLVNNFKSQSVPICKEGVKPNTKIILPPKENEENVSSRKIICPTLKVNKSWTSIFKSIVKIVFTPFIRIYKYIKNVWVK